MGGDWRGGGGGHRVGTDRARPAGRRGCVRGSAGVQRMSKEKGGQWVPVGEEGGIRTAQEEVQKEGNLRRRVHK